MRDYELVTVWNPDLGEDGVQSAVERVGALVAARGGEVANTNVWGRRRLAYFIDRHGEGYYVVQDLRLDPARSGEIEGQLNINEDLLRHLLVRKGE